ncbi:MAG: hypothetical protein HC886_17895, partial [Leptolyngbyaceae cyanobacterium SM1_1_3]|nr:hypothetical protein [Leptolyngbyaceae cyanobacterium SM1_1_3]
MALTLTLLSETFAICRLDPRADIPGWTTHGSLLSITRTAEELSIVCPRQSAAETNPLPSRPWTSALRV